MPLMSRTLGQSFLLLAALFSSGACASAGGLRAISIRNHVGQGDNVLILGFSVSGDSARPVLLRAIGPTLGLSPFNVSGVLPDPRVQVFTGAGGPILDNDDWGGGVALASVFAQTGSFALPAGSRDAAVFSSYSPGGYTCVSSSQVVGQEGEALLELYDAGGSGAGSAIANLSVRGTLKAGGTFITGFAVSGDSPRKMLVRAIGPSLAQFGVGSALPDPRITLYRDQTPLASNEDWSVGQDAAKLAATAQRVGSFALLEGTRDAALLLTLSPGNYTAHITSADPSRSGVVLAEVYDAEEQPLVTPDAGAPTVRVTAGADCFEGGASSFVVRRSGGDGRALQVQVSLGGTAQAGADFESPPLLVSLPAGVVSATLPIKTLGDGLAESTESIECTVVATDSYRVSTDNAFAAVLVRDATLRATGWQAEYFSNAKLEGTPVLRRIDADLDFDWVNGSPAPEVPVDKFSARWTGSLWVETSGEYTFVAQADDYVWLWIDGQPVISRPKYDWQPTSATVSLAGGAWHSVRVDYGESGGKAQMRLGWYGPGMTMRAVGGNDLVRPDLLAASVSGPWEVRGVVGAPFQLALASVGAVGELRVEGLPVGLALDRSTGRVTGFLTEAGVREFTVTASNTTGSGTTRVRIEAMATDRQATSERWNSVAGAVPEIPIGAPTERKVVTSLASAGGAPGPFVRRISGMITAPATGVYGFWVRGAGRTEFWLADSDEPGDRTLRCSATTAASWETQAGQKATPIALEAGKRYYFELRQAGASSGEDNAAVAWTPPWADVTKPLEIVPTYSLSNYTQLPAEDGRTVLVAALRPSRDVASPAYGTVSLALDESAGTALVSTRFSGLGSPVTAARLLLNAGTVQEVRLRNLGRSPESTGSWTLTPVDGKSVAELIALMKSGAVTARVETAFFPAGELEASLQTSQGSARAFWNPRTTRCKSGLWVKQKTWRS
jgi:hypothetical protein